MSGVCLPLVVCPSSVAGDLAGDAAGAVISSVTSGAVAAANWLVDQAAAFASTTEPQLSSPSIAEQLAMMRQVGLLVVAPVLCAASIGPVLRQDGRRLLRVWGVGLPVAVFAGMVCAQLVGVGLQVTDFLCACFTTGGKGSIQDGLVGLLSAKSLLAMPPFVQMVLAGLVSLGGLMVWLELMVRSAAVDVATFFMPLALVAFIWPATVGVAKRAVEILVALILSKFVIVASLSLGLAAMGSSGTNPAVSGCAIVLLAAFSPFVLFRLTPIVEASAVAHLEGLSRRPVRLASQAAAAPAHPVVQTVMRAASGRSGGAGDVGVPSALAPRLREAPADYPFPTPVGGGDE